MITVMPGWTVIAMRPRRSLEGPPAWRPIPGAPVSIQEAWVLADAGKLFLANRHQPDRVELVVRPCAAAISGS
jgi:hypothetical protein